MSEEPSAASSSALAQRRKSARNDNSAEYQQRRQQLINAAAEVFHRKGFGETSLRDIAEQAGTDRTTLYYYVTSKQELFVEVIRESLLEGVSAGERILASDDTPTVRLRELLRALMLGYTQHYPYLFVWAQQDMSHLDIREAPQRELAELAQRSYEIMREVVVEGLADGSFHSRLGPGVIAQTFIGAVARSSMWYTPEYDATPEDLAEDLAALLVDGLTARPRRRAKKVSDTGRTRQ
jgi:AcrR family transcriptional regulator